MSQAPTLVLVPDQTGRVHIPSLEDQTRPRRLAWPSGRVELEPLPLLSCLLELTEEEAEAYLPPPDSYGWGNTLLNRMAWAKSYDKMLVFTPDPSRYGQIPGWFPRTDCQGRDLTETAQVDRFLLLLNHVIQLPKDHRETDPKALVAALFELHDAYQDGAFESWDEGNDWEVVETPS